MNKAELGQVFTDKQIADYMVSLLTVDKKESVLDPCFGGAAFIDALQRANFSNITGCEIDSYWYDKAKKRLESVQLFQGDFLKFTSEDMFDAIIMNPPYIRQEKIDDLADFGISKDALASNPIFKLLPRTANLYMYFVIKGISLLRENGEMVIIFPSSWLDAKNGQDFKDYLYNECNVEKQVHIHGEVFEGGALVDVVILKITKSKSANSTDIQYLQAAKGELIPVESGRSVLDLGFTTPFSEYGCVRRGLTTGYNEAFINPITENDISEYLVPIISSPKDIAGYTTAHARLDSLLLIRDNSNISTGLQQYIEQLQTHILSSKKPKTLFEKVQRGDCWYKLNVFDGRGIVFSYFVRNEMKFVYNPSDAIIRDNFYVITPSIDALIMFALLNNYYTFYQLETCGKKYGAGLLKLQRYDIEGLYFPSIEAFSTDDYETLVSLAQRMIDNNDASLVDDITRVIAPYTSVSFQHIHDEYFKVKQHRLENR